MANSTIFFAIPGDINSPTGGYAYDRRLIAELRELGVELGILQLSGRFPQPTATDLEEANAKFARLPDGSIVIADGLAFGVMDDIAERHAHRLRIIALCHHPLALETGISPTQAEAYRVSETRALKAVAAIIVTSHSTATTLENSFGVDGSRITVALPGTDPQVFAECRGSPPILLSVASLTRRKGHDVLIDALARLPHLAWQAHFVGGKEFDPEWVLSLQKQIADYGLTKRILLLGNQEDITSAYREADVFVLPSHYEGYGMAFAEALSFGLPVIAADTDAARLLIPRSAGILVPPADAPSLAAAISLLLNNHRKRNNLQAGARKAAANLPRWADCARKIMELLLKLKHE